MKECLANWRFSNALNGNPPGASRTLASPAAGDQSRMLAVHKALQRAERPMDQAPAYLRASIMRAVVNQPCSPVSRPLPAWALASLASLLLALAAFWVMLPRRGPARAAAPQPVHPALQVGETLAAAAPGTLHPLQSELDNIYRDLDRSTSIALASLPGFAAPPRR